MQNIDMSVPVRQTDDDLLAAEAETERAQLREMSGALRAVALSCAQPTWTARTRAARRAHCDREVKGLVKRLATGAAGLISERAGRTEVRVRVYTDTVTLFKSTTDVLAGCEQRSRRLLLALTGAVGLNAVLMALLVWSGAG